MRDPRLAEIDFLAQLEREGTIVWQVPTTKSVDLIFGLRAHAFREMLFDMLHEDLLNGAGALLRIEREKGQTYGGDVIYTTKIENETFSDDGTAVEHMAGVLTRKTLSALWDGKKISLCLNHKGRLRLWRLRDELRTNREREPFGILFDKRAWDRELAVQVPFVSATAPLSLLALDLDHFKSVNDTLGHAKGDAVLQRYLTIVRDSVGGVGDAFRTGGDEVMVALGNTTIEKATAIAEAIRAAFAAETFEGLTFTKRPTISVGVATFSAVITAEEAFKLVDDQLYAAKGAGRDCVRAAPLAR